MDQYRGSYGRHASDEKKRVLLWVVSRMETIVERMAMAMVMVIAMATWMWMELIGVGRKESGRGVVEDERA
jgi:hypothetical protein